MSDRPLTQQRLVASLASLLSTTPEPTVVPFLKAFWATMARQWTLLDVLRMDKFLLLVRRYIGASFEWMKRNGWSKIVVEEHSRMMAGEGGPLDPSATVPDGLRYHVLDCWVDELSGSDSERQLGGEVLETVMKPVREVADRGKSRVLRGRAKDVLEDKRLADWPSGEGGGEDDGFNEDEEWGGFDD